MSYTREQIEAEARKDYAMVLGLEIETDHVIGYQCCESVDKTEKAFPFRVIVIETPEQDLLNHCLDWLDPQWNVVPAPGETRLDGLESLWVYGTSYCCDGDVQGHWRLAGVAL